MSSPLLTGLLSQIEKLDRFFLVRKDDFSQYTDEDHARALAFTMLASAELEFFVERRCEQIASGGIDRFLKGQDTASGRALLIWHTTRRTDAALLIHESDVHLARHLCWDALQAYRSMVKSSHGIDSRDFLKLTYPIGLREGAVPITLIASLETLSDRRNPASHGHVNRAKSMREPKQERDLVDQILKDLTSVDEALNDVLSQYPLAAV
ncbi:hypothetical protein M3667_14255 [Microbacterium sp. P26]|uniref:hypothetical protein n=1 Tax=Microbacterium TaxID=33882 RepID=UPI0020418E55|nr:hypothetical protein [Microbacterium sp. P26]MCM3503031.1 hypothetical protein [Microbacterium sp. P26]